MKCDNCDNEATVHEVMIKGGQKVEKHLCEHCALKQGVGVQAAPLGKLLTQFITAHGQVVVGGGTGAGRGGAGPGPCPGCGLSFAQFRKTGLLGCPDCYEAFAEQLTPLFERAHEGAVHHVGKAPPQFGQAGPGAPLGGGRIGRHVAEEEERRERARRQHEEQEARRARVATLKRRLDEAVAAEQYERAARLRDELGRLTDGAGGGGAEDGGSEEGGEEGGVDEGGGADG